MKIRLVAFEPTDATDEMRQDFVRVEHVDGTILLDTCVVPGGKAHYGDDAKFTLNLSFVPRRRNEPRVEEAVDARELAITWFAGMRHNSTVSRRQIQGIKKLRTSCICGGTAAWFAETTIDGMAAGEISLGCICHTTAQQLIDRMEAHIWERP